jgi:beta-lactamase regulating signal transducer with metallopeptidase domain
MNHFFTFMIDWSLKTVVTVALGFLCALLLRRRSAATRHLIWRITLSAIAMLPLAMALTPKGGAPAVMEPIQAPVRAAILRLDAPRQVQAYSFRKTLAPIAEVDAKGVNGEQIVVLVYAVGFAALLAFWVAGYMKIRRIAKTSARTTDIMSPHRVFVASDPELRVPITFGLLSPVILLPRESAEWPDQRVRAAILHESAHIARRDWAWQTASHLMRSLQWFNPAVWLMNGALQSTSEAATDDEVLMQFAMGPSSYANELLNVAEAARGNLRAATAMARPGGVATRLRRIVAKGIDRARPPRRLAVGLGLAFSVAAALVAVGTVAEAAGGGTRQKAQSLVTSLLSKVGLISPEIGDPRYEAKLPGGGVVRMVALTGAKDGDGPLWRPDGSLASQTERTLLQPILNRGPAEDPPEGRVITFYLQVSKLPMKRGDSENGIFRIKSPNGWQYRMGSNTDEKDGRLQRDEWTAPVTARICDMDCGISYGAYKVVGRGKFGDGQFHAKIGEPAGESVNVTFRTPGKSSDTQARLECYDRQGNLVQGGGELLWGNTEGDGQVFDFPYRSEDVKRIKSFRFSTREYEHVLIRGIRLPSPDASQ